MFGKFGKNLSIRLKIKMYIICQKCSNEKHFVLKRETREYETKYKPKKSYDIYITYCCICGEEVFNKEMEVLNDKIVLEREQ